MEGKRKYIEDAAKVIDGRVAALEAEIEREIANASPVYASDRAAVLEAKLLASMIRQLGRAPYKGDPYKVARDRRNRLGDIAPKAP